MSEQNHQIKTRKEAKKTGHIHIANLAERFKTQTDIEFIITILDKHKNKITYSVDTFEKVITEMAAIHNDGKLFFHSLIEGRRITTPELHKRIIEWERQNVL
jgi:CRISPR/Cas system CSM-associated protein Csm4 (group 5 of RAMP superfamily)